MSADIKRKDSSGQAARVADHGARPERGTAAPSVITSTPWGSALTAQPANLSPAQFRQVLTPQAEASRQRYVDAVWKRNGGIR